MAGRRNRKKRGNVIESKCDDAGNLGTYGDWDWVKILNLGQILRLKLLY